MNGTWDFEPKGKYKRLARIDNVSLGFEDHGIFTVMLDLNYVGTPSYQGAGHMMLSYSPKENNYKPIGSPKGIDFLIAIMRVGQVDRWERLQGVKLWAVFDDDKYSSIVRGLASLDNSQVFMFDSIELWDKKGK